MTSLRWRHALLASSALMLLPALPDRFAIIAPAEAGGPPPLSPAWFAARQGAAAATAPSAGGAGNAAASLAQVQQSLVNLQKAAQGIAAAQALQASARAAAAAAAGTVPNGIGPGGLQPAAGYNSPGAGIWIGVQPGQPLRQSTANGATQVTVTQTAPQAILNWQSFNIGKQTTLAFDQSAGGGNAANWVALNRVNDPSGVPSKILGAITAPGKVYVINRNGVIFGGGSQVNVGALIASAADLADPLFTATGIYSPVASGVYTPSFSGAPAASTIEVEAGAAITTSAPAAATTGGGYVMLLGGAVRNAGQITTPDGQTVLAAGQDFILRQGYDATQTSTGALAGNLFSTTFGTEVAVRNGGAAANAGLITAATGDITMIGKSVAQNGVALATTAVSKRGTIHLLTDTTDPAGSVTLGPGSLTTIALDPSGATALDAQRAALIAQSSGNAAAFAVPLNDQVFLPDRRDESRVEITTGGAVAFQGGSLTLAQGGQVAVSAAGRVFAAGDAAIDVGGAVNVPLPMSANLVTVNIQGFELRDAPVNRDTTRLNSRNVTLDARDLVVVPASSAYPQTRAYTAGGLLEVSGELANIGHTVAEWMTPGGTIALYAAEVVAQPGAVFNIAGGSVQYQGGYVRTSWLTGSDGKLYNVATAPAGLTYTGVYGGVTVEQPRWNVTQVFQNPLIAPSQIWQAGYTVGRDAGKLVLSTPTAIFEGTIDAGVVAGRNQTQPRPAGVTDGYTLAQTVVPLGGTLQYGNFATTGTLNGTYPTDLRLTDAAPAIAATLGVDTPLPADRVNTAWFSASALSASGLASLALSTAGSLTLDGAVTLGPGGQVGLIAPAARIAAPLTVPGGTIAIGNLLVLNNQPGFLSAGQGTGITLAAGATLNAAGLWTNATLDPAHAAGIGFVDGGAVTLDSSQTVALAPGSAIDVAAGAAIRFSGATVAGAGGTIALTAADPLAINTPWTGSTAPLALGGTLEGHGVARGGALALTVPDVAIGAPGTAAPADALVLPAAFFDQGFASYTLNGYASLAVAPGTVVAPVAPVYAFTAASPNVPTGAPLAQALALVQLPPYLANPRTATLTQRPGVSLTLQSLRTANVTTASVGGPLSVGQGATISVDAGQSVTLQGYGQITVEGTISAPGGTVALLDPQNDAAVPAAGLSIWLGPESRLDVAARAVTAEDADGHAFGIVPNGGTVALGSAGGTNGDGGALATPAAIVMRPGAVIDASGASAALFTVNGGPASPALPPAALATGRSVTVASSGGAILAASYTGVALDGTLRAASGGPGGGGGTLGLTLETPAYQSTQVDAALLVPRTIVVSQSGQSPLATATLKPGDPLPPAALGQASIAADQVAAGGFGNLVLSTSDILRFDGDVTLSATQSITLGATAITATGRTTAVTVAAPSVTFAPAQTLIEPQIVQSGSGFYPSLQPSGVILGLSTLTGAATLTVAADLIDLTGAAQVSVVAKIPQGGGGTLDVNEPGFGKVSLASTGDLRLAAGSNLAAPGDIALAARQIYGSGEILALGTLAIARVGTTLPPLPLSVGGALTFAATTIEQGGVVRAPFGTITFEGAAGSNSAAAAIGFLPGSVTSVSGNGLTDLYGGTTDGVTYQVNGGTLAPFGGSLSVLAQSVAVAGGATLDLSGGGTLSGAGFISGRGGSTDTLLTPWLQFNAARRTVTAPALASDPVYAILPGFAGAYAPAAPSLTANTYAGALPLAGQQITIPGGVPGLPAGTYTLLPAYYALLPGAWRVELSPGAGILTVPVQALPNGSYLATAYGSIANTGIRAALATPAVLTPGSQVRDYSQYDEERPGDFLLAQAALFGTPRPALPADAKTLQLEYPQTPGPLPALSFAGTALFGAAPGGLGGTLVVGSPNGTAAADFEITADAATPTPGYVSIRASALDAFGAQRLSIGGIELLQAGDVVVFQQQQTNSVTVRSGATLAAPEVFLIAAPGGGTLAPAGITVAAGATIDTLAYGAPIYDSTAGFVYQNATPNGDGTFGGGAGVLAVSNGYLNFLPPQTGSTVPITIADGAALYANGTVAFATLQPVSLSSRAQYGAKYLSFSAGSINVGSDAALAALAAAHALPTGLQLNQDVLSALLRGNPAVGTPALLQLTLTASQSINFIGSADLDTRNPATGQASLQQLVLNAPAIYGAGGNGDVDTIAAGTLVWNGLAAGGASALPGGAIAGGPGNGAGTLNVIADRIVLGYPATDIPNNQITLDRTMLGFATVNLTGSTEIAGNNLGSLTVFQQQDSLGAGTGGALNLITPLLTGAPGAVLRIAAGGALTLAPPAGAGPASATPNALGAAISLAAASIGDTTAIVAPSGQITLAATGDITLGAGARLDVAGPPVGFFDQTRALWGGTVRLQSATGSIRQDPAATIDIAAAGAAGSLAVAATRGIVALAGPILGAAGGGATAGSIEIGAGTLTDFAGLNARLDAGGVTGARSFDIKTGDLTIQNEANPDGSTSPLLVAQSIAISVDGGSLTVDGTLNASGPTPGSIRLAASGDLTLTGHAVLDAHATAAQTDSTGATVDAANRATVALTVADGASNAGTGTLRLLPGATIDVSAAPGVACALGTAPCGTVELNAPRTGETSGDLRATATGPLAIRGAASIALNAFWSYQPGDANGTIVQDNGAGAGGAEVNGTGLLGLAQIDTRSTGFVTAALANTSLPQRLAGLTAYTAAFHLRPGVEIDGAGTTGNLTVQGDLDLAPFRYASLNPNSQKTATYGSGEPGALVLRAGGNLMVNGSISDGFGTPPEPSAGAAADPADNGWLLFPSVHATTQGQEPFGSDIILPAGLPGPVTLLAGTQYATVSEALGYDIPIAAATLSANAVIPQQVTLAADVTLPGEWVTRAAITAGGTTYARGTILPAGTVLPAGSMLGAGTVLPTDVPIAAGTWLAGGNLALFSGSGPVLAQSVQLGAGSLIPAGTVMQLGASSLPLRPTNAAGVQGLIEGDAPMLAAGSLSWSIRLAAGADLGAADSRILLPPPQLGGGGNLTLADTHYTPQVTVRPRGTTIDDVLPSFSVIRTGTGDLDVLAGGALTETSLFGLYTAGTQSPPVGATITDPVDTLDAGRNQFDLVRGLNGGTTVLGPNGGPYESLVSGSTATYHAWYPEDGGNVLVAVQGDLTGDILQGIGAQSAVPASGAVNNWLWRQGGDVAGQPGAWWINFGSYVADPVSLASNHPVLAGFAGVGALGGGNVTIRAGGTVGPATSRGSADYAQSGGLDVAVGSTGRVVDGAVVQTGGGNIDLRIAGGLDPNQSNGSGDLGGTLTDLRGSLAVRAGAVGQVALSYGIAESGDPRAPSAFTAATATATGGPVVMLGDATATIMSGRDLTLAGAGDPTRTMPYATTTVAEWNTTPFLVTSGGAETLSPGGGISAFSLWQPATGLTLIAAGGNLDPFAFSDGANAAATDSRFIYPPSLTAVAASGSIYYGQPTVNGPTRVELAPSPVGQLALLAAGSIYAEAYGFSLGALPVDISGAPSGPGAVPTPLTPAFTNLDGSLTNEARSASVSTTPALFAFEADTPTTDLHANDPEPARIYAGGDIVGLQFGETWSFAPNLPVPVTPATWYLAAKPARILAGRDIVGAGQAATISPGAPFGGVAAASDLILNERTTDVSVVAAGRDIIADNIDIAGPGGLYLQAGRNLYQGSQGVLESIGQIVAAASQSRSGGAAITAIAGVGAAGPDYTGFANRYFDPANQANPDDPLDSAANAGKVAQTYGAALLAWLQQTEGYAGSAAGALAAFDALPPEQQAGFVLPVYFDELRLSGRESTDPASPRFKSYVRGRAAIATLFPDPASYGGDITLFSANAGAGVSDGGIRTDFGGSITLLAPGGQTVIGVNGVTPGAHAGLLTQGSGDIDIYSQASVLLGESRVFTTFGGGITIWSAHGDINAGRGAKTTQVYAPEVIAYDNYASVSLSPTVPTTGAGIATLAPVAGVSPGDVDLVAPLGVIDAGEAGIRASGNANLAALVVVNAANIEAQGKVTGIPVIAVPNVAAETAASAAAGAAQQAAQQAATGQKQTQVPAIITVEVVGYGGTDAETGEQKRKPAGAP